MTTDINLFFREATLRICGSLEIEYALWQCLLYIRKFIPADFLAITTYDLDSGISKIIAGARLSGGMRFSFETRASANARAIMENWYKNPDRGTHVRIVDDMNKDEVFRAILGSVDKNTFAEGVKVEKETFNMMVQGKIMQMRLKLGETMVGTLIVLDPSGQSYTKNHSRLLSLLNEPFAIALSNYLRYQEVSKLKDLLTDDNRYLHTELRRISGEEIVGADFGLRDVMDLIYQVAPLDSPVLLLGETGTGKEVIANAIHNSSLRKAGPLIKVNCGAIPKTLLISELFGHEKGAFTGAVSCKRGRFERAEGGTIFFDEIGELSIDAQVSLLRVLQEKEFERIGGTNPIKVNTRIIAATHRNLQEMIKQETFREDLYFRLNVFPIMIPPLRDRKPDIPPLVHHFIRKKSQEMGKASIDGITQNTMSSLLAYNWPGNVRELENAIERALILCEGSELRFPFLLSASYQNMQEQGIPNNTGGNSLELDCVVSEHIIKVMEMTKGRVQGKGGAAELLNMNPSTLRKRMKKLRIQFGQKWKKSYSGDD
jgi:transcriptional regulator with GAF, ATPase, and Fis domain